MEVRGLFKKRSSKNIWGKQKWKIITFIARPEQILLSDGKSYMVMYQQASKVSILRNGPTLEKSVLKH